MEELDVMLWGEDLFLDEEGREVVIWFSYPLNYSYQQCLETNAS